MPGLEPGPPGEYLTDRLTREAERFIERNRERPFFLYLAHFAVHIPLAARPEKVAAYRNTGKPGTQTNAIYAAMIESMDEGVGRVLKKLDDLRLSERTILIFTSDNGGLATVEGPNTPATINAPMREGKGYLYEGGLRVPLVVRWPGVIPAGAVCAKPVTSTDFFPTLLEAAGVTLPANRTLDGVSLMPLLRQTGEPKRDALFWHYPHYSNQGGKPGGAIRAGDLKLIEFYETGRLELFDLGKDPRENRNLAGEMPRKALELQQKLDAWRRAIGAQMMLPNAGFRPAQQADDGTILLHARRADIDGTQLRFEPLPHKNTLGFWTRVEDRASWDLEVSKPGAFAVEILHGCGQGSGGSEVEFAVGDRVLKMIVRETGGFQNFVERNIGTIQLSKPGRYTLTVKPVSKPGVAVMDLRQVVLRPASR